MKYTVFFQANVGQASEEIEADSPESAIIAALVRYLHSVFPQIKE